MRLSAIKDMSKPLLLAVSEIGGYPDFSPMYQALGYQVITETSMRKVLKLLKKQTPAIIVAEFNYQSDFRDRTSSLESLMSVVQRFSNTQVIIFYDKEHIAQLARLEARYTLSKTLPFPILESGLKRVIESFKTE
jgi:DNA-binding NarL/FixJ family response regulator